MQDSPDLIRLHSYPDPRAHRCPGSSADHLRPSSAADGLFIAKEIGGDNVDLIALFELHARAVFDSAVQMVQEDTR